MLARIIGAFVLAALVFGALASPYSFAASSSDFSSANFAISSAYTATLNAEKSGGNVSSLVSQLNSGIALVQKAQAENAKDPGQALVDLQNATNIANQVSSESAAIGQQGSSSRNVQDAESIGGAVLIVILAVLAYLYGGRIYRKGWLFLFRDYVVKPANG